MARAATNRGAALRLRLQVGMVAVLFVAALVALWATGASVVARERRRASAKGALERAGAALDAAGRAALADAKGFPFFPDRDPLDARLAAASGAALGRFEGVEGGYFAAGFKTFLGASGVPGGGPLPASEADQIETQVDAAVRKDRVLFAVEEVAGPRPATVAIRAAPVAVDGRVVGATWVMTRLEDSVFVDRSVRGYQVASGLALGGVALALALTAGLAATVRRQAVERDRLQSDLRRSERLAALGKLLAGVAHEVRNPLAGIRSTVQLWQRGIGPDGDSFADLLAEVDRLDGIVGRLLHFSRANAQEPAPGDLNAVVAEAARLAAGPAEERGVAVVVDLDPDLPAVALVAPAVLQVFRNLTTNALQASPAGGTLRLSTRSDPHTRSVEATVADTGPGLPAEVRAHLFEPFYTTKTGGTGLGLAIAREIALAHRGDLRAGANPDGPGAAFTLTLPAATRRREPTHADV